MPAVSTAVTVFTAFLWVLAFANNIVGTGSVAVISRRFGEGDDRRTELSIKNTFLAKFLVGTVSGAIGILVGTYSSTFIAAPTLLYLETHFGGDAEDTSKKAKKRAF